MSIAEPENANKLATDAQISNWVEKFASYRQRPTRESLLGWLQRFAPDHLDIAHRLLDAVELVSELQIHQIYNSALNQLEGWSTTAADRRGRWYFVGVGSAGESGPAMLRMFREANGLSADRWQSYFVSTRELPRLALSALDHVVFVDDFAGSGKQMVDYWPLMQELVASEATCYLLLTAVTERATIAIENNTELKLKAGIILNAAADVFSDECDLFTREEKLTLHEYGKIAWRDHPRGFGECGLTIVLSHKTPNNTLPILHANHERWVGPFPRNLIRAA